MKILKNTSKITFMFACVAAGLLLQINTSFAATHSATAAVTPKKFVGKCPKKFLFRGVIRASRPGRVQYKWIRSDNANAPVQTIYFARPGTKRVSTTWTLGGTALPTYSGWQAIQIIYPLKAVSNRARFRLSCRGAGGGRRLPDLTVRLRAPRTAVAGSNIGPQIKVHARNVGNAPARGTDVGGANGYMIDIILSKDTNAPAGFATYSPNYHEDVLLKGGRISNTKTLAPAVGKSYPTGGGIPANTPAGNYFVCAKVDSGAKIAEKRENNNVACSRIRIRRRLVVGPITPRPIRIREDCVGFNSRTVALKKVGARWKIVDGGHYLHDFGSKKAEGAKAFKIIKRYRANRHCFVGRPKASLHYFLTAGGAPSGGMAGEDCVSMNPVTVQAKKVSGDWKVIDGSHWIFSFGNKANEAKLSAAIIKKYKFSKSCYVGRPGASFTYMRR